MTNPFKRYNSLVLKNKLTKLAADAVLMILMFGLCFLILQPLLNKIAISFMEEQDLYDSTVITVPRHFTLENYRVAIKLMDYGNSLMSTFSLATVVAVLQVVSTLLVGYSFARYDFPLKKLWFAMVILVIVVPQQTYASALLLNFRYFDPFGLITAFGGQPLNLTGTVVPLLFLSATCTGLKCGLYVYLFRQYFRNVPKDIEEAAYIDGCGTVRTLFTIMLPDAMPLATSCFLFSFVWQWTDNYFSNLFMKSSALLPNRLSALANSLISYLEPARPSATYSNAMNATGTLLVLLPVIIVYLIAQKRFVESLNSVGVKM